MSRRFFTLKDIDGKTATIYFDDVWKMEVLHGRMNIYTSLNVVSFDLKEQRRRQIALGIFGGCMAFLNEVQS